MTDVVTFRWSTGNGDLLNVTVEVTLVRGRLQCRALRIEAESDINPVTTEALRGIPVGEFVRLAADQLCLGDEEAQNLPDKGFAVHGMTDQALRDVANVYTWCVRTGRKPLGVLEREYGVPRAKASRWIDRARRTHPELFA